ncbi:MAG TPA: ribose-5-phosphate isomerase RpiA [Tepidisphaeraceae bacterium]|nr:ribose-5-phosphate isomerase RpiA [Tepidisphaeraceae bacterium]
MNPKDRAAQAAVELLENNAVVGLGTGSTADYFLIALSRALSSGQLRGIRGIPTSKRSEQRAIELGIPLTSLRDRPDVTVDGADEIAPNLDLIKGLGGALLREKIVAQNSDRLIIIADASKKVSILGEKSPLPVEVAVFGYETQEKFLRSLGCEPALRKNPDGSPVLSDNSNYIYDCRFPGIDDPHAIDRALKSRAGIIESGLFLGIAELALIGTDTNVQHLTRPA